MRRRHAILILCSLCFLVLSLVGSWMHAVDASVPKKKATLKEQLESGLKARLPSEFAFIDKVVGLVEEGTLPRKLVLETFQWARRKRPYPFPYFERGLIRRAAARGIRL